ncbi:uncharacterized protein LOC123354602 [Mauremys mutica]|uniref:uncharacterized protein LOC123354602 n=1 Tax=Mauremys mutica TaxID=74926 RepID=UPI001D16EAD4|nr:uncharacterized protein LOC123354602 [Mauremys mutica]
MASTQAVKAPCFCSEAQPLPVSCGSAWCNAGLGRRPPDAAGAGTGWDALERPPPRPLAVFCPPVTLPQRGDAPEPAGAGDRLGAGPGPGFARGLCRCVDTGSGADSDPSGERITGSLVRNAGSARPARWWRSESLGAGLGSALNYPLESPSRATAPGAPPPMAQRDLLEELIPSKPEERKPTSRSLQRAQGSVGVPETKQEQAWLGPASGADLLEESIPHRPEERQRTSRSLQRAQGRVGVPDAKQEQTWLGPASGAGQSLQHD